MCCCCFFLPLISGLYCADIMDKVRDNANVAYFLIIYIIISRDLPREDPLKYQKNE